MRTIFSWLTVAVFLSACGPSEQQKAELAEKRRVECQDKFCKGDVEPKRNMATEVALKLDGQWYVGPKEYFARGSGAVFHWPEKSPAYAPGDFPRGVKGNDFYDVAIEIFLSTAKTNPPGKSLYKTLQEMEAKGLVLEKRNPRPGLQVWRTRKEGRLPETWYVASSLKEPSGEPPTIACRETDPKYARCTTGFRWQTDVAASMRFRAAHGPDWPEIYQETDRVLKLLRKI